MQFGLGELEFPKFQTAVAPGNWDSGPGTSNFFGIDPLPGGMRYYTFKFFPINNPIYGMNADDSLKSQRGRMLSGTFEINEKNPRKYNQWKKDIKNQSSNKDKDDLLEVLEKTRDNLREGGNGEL